MCTHARKNTIRKGLGQMPAKSLKRLLKILVRSPQRVLMNGSIYQKGKG